MSGVTINRSMFRAYDIRGLVDEDLSPNVVYRIGQGIGTMLGQGGARTFVVGHDVRLTSPTYAASMISALRSTGIDVIDIGLVPTPLMYFAVSHLGTDGGVMITASHNPPQFNGIKIRRGVEPVVTEELQQLADVIEAGQFATGAGSLRQENVILSYIETVTGKFKLARPLSIVADFGNGCAGLVGPQVLRGIGAKVEALYAEPDGTFPNHHPDPMKLANLATLQAKVRELGADMGVAFDGDGDRLGMVDETGAVVDPSQFITMLARQLLPDNPGGKVVFEVKASQALAEEVDRLGGELIMTKVGYPFLLAAMREEHGLFGGEMSGHFYFDDVDINFDDGTFAAATLAQAVAGQPKSFGTLVRELPSYPSTPEISVHCPDEEKFHLVEQLQKWFLRRYKVVTIDGARVLFDDGWGVVRASNTEPRLTLRFEATTNEGLERIKAIFREALESVGLEPNF